MTEGPRCPHTAGRRRPGPGAGSSLPLEACQGRMPLGLKPGWQLERRGRAGIGARDRWGLDRDGDGERPKENAAGSTAALSQSKWDRGISLPLRRKAAHKAGTDRGNGARRL